ncbi:MAG: hypothetical protein R3B98_05215 [Hyphomonas sp.]
MPAQQPQKTQLNIQSGVLTILHQHRDVPRTVNISNASGKDFNVIVYRGGTNTKLKRDRIVTSEIFDSSSKQKKFTGRMIAVIGIANGGTDYSGEIAYWFD